MKIGRATIHNMDCMDLLKSCDDNHFDLAIVDPPYGIGVDGGIGGGVLTKKSGFEKKHWKQGSARQKQATRPRKYRVSHDHWKQRQRG